MPAYRTRLARRWKTTSLRWKEGLTGHAFASGMAAISTLMTLVKAGEHVVCSQNVYGGTYRYFSRFWRTMI